MKKVIGVFCLICILLASVSFAAYPEDLENAEIQLISETDAENIETTAFNPTEVSEETEIIYDDVYKMANDVVISGIIDGNVYVMAQTAKIENATIYGNLYVMAQTVDIVDSDIGSSIYTMAQKITFSGMTNDMYALGEDVEFTENSYIWRTVRTIAENLIVNGNISRDLYASVGNMTIGDNTVIEGKLNYSSDNEGNISETAQIAEVQFEENDKEDVNIDTEKITTTAIVLKNAFQIISSIFKTLVVALIIVFLVNKFYKLKRTENVTTDLLLEMCKGAGVLVVVPVIVFLLMCTIIGIAFGFVVLAIYFVLLYIATAIVALEITYRILSKKEKIKKGSMVGFSILISLVIWAIGLIPVIGGAIKFIILLVGLGILFDLIFQKVKKEEINEN